MENNPSPRRIKLRLNLFDTIFIICAICLAVFILVNSSRSNSGAGLISSGSREKIVYTIELQGMINNAAELIKPGDSLVDKVEQRAIGTVVSVELVQAMTSSKDYVTGDRIITELPERTDAIITVEAQATVTDSQISVDGFAIRAGTRISVNGPLYNGGGYITYIDRGAAK